MTKQLFLDIQNTKDAQRNALLGLVVFIERSDSGHSKKQFDIVDGQQRLTSLVLLLAIIRSELYELEERLESQEDRQDLWALASDIRKCLYREVDGKKQLILEYEMKGTLHEKILQGICMSRTEVQDVNISSILNDREKLRLMNLLDDSENSQNQAKEKWVLEKKSEGGVFNQTKAKAQKVTKNFVQLTSLVTGLMSSSSAEANFRELKGFTNIILDRVELIIYSTNNDEEAFNLFETLNDRGMAVAAYDLIKNYCIQRDSSNIDKIGVVWREIFTDILKEEKSRMKQFLRCYHNSTRNFITNNDLFSNFRELIREKIKVLPSAWLDQVLREEAENFAALVGQRPLDLPDSNLHNVIVALQSTKSTQWQTIALSLNRIWVKHSKSKIYKKCTEILEEVLKATVVIEIKSIRGSVVEKAFPKYARDLNDILSEGVTEVESIVEGMEGVLALIKDKRVTDNLTSTGCEQLLIESTFENSSIYSLLMFNARAQCEEGRKLSQMSVEHVLPKRPKDISDWPTWDDNSHEEKFCSLGNFILLSIDTNLRVRNNKYSQKSGEYEEVNAQDCLPASNGKHWSNVTDWTMDVVNERTKLVATRIVQLLD